MTAGKTAQQSASNHYFTGLFWDHEGSTAPGGLMLQPQYIDRCSQPDRLSWQGVIDALIAGHQLPRAAITDTVLAHGTNRLLNRSTRIEGLGYAVKNVTVFPDNRARAPFLPSVQGICTVFDEYTGQARALIDSELLTYWKTAADSVLGASLLGPAEPEHLLIFGAGQVARSLIDAYTTIFPSIATVTLCVRRLQSADWLRQKLAADANRPPFVVRFSTEPGAVVPLADIVATATTSETPVLQGNWLTAGAHVDLVGAYTVSMREADDHTLQNGALYVDCRDTTVEHIGELVIPLASGAIQPDSVLGDLYDLIALGTGDDGRIRDPQQITVFKNGGGAHLDLMVAHHLMSLSP
ncbi:MAG: ornithine cyclodeaminase [Pseudomonadota bacterium]|nr:ornithine cyclodeaminase [Pseudomonadota bacterium]